MALQRPLSVVGVGASAGGVEAFSGFFKDMPVDTGLGFILVTHLARGHPSALTEIVSQFTSMPVMEAEDDHVIQPDHIYICPPDHVLTVVDGHIRLHQRTSDMQRRPIDVFLSSLSEAYGENAVGI